MSQLIHTDDFALYASLTHMRIDADAFMRLVLTRFSRMFWFALL